nr:hypothetical protein [Tanacetum cinerariifolium]
MVQKSGTQCYNCKEYGHVARECQKPKRAKDAAYHREKMLLCKQEEARIQLNAEHADWKDDTDDESDDQELEAHYMYMAKIQENTNVLAPGMYKLHTDHTRTRTSKLPQDSKKTNKRVSFSTGVILTTSVSRPQLKSNPMGERVLRSNSRGKKLEVEEHRRNVKFPKNKTSVTACNDSLNAKTLNVKSVFAMKSTCFIRDLKGNDLLTAWLWHCHLSYLNFDTINLLSKNDIMVGLPKLKFIKDHLCSSCELGKAKRKYFHSKLTSSSKRRLHLLHIDLCVPMQVASINGKRYVLVIVDDYSRNTWTHFLRSKDETPEVLIDFLRLIQRGLQAQVRVVRTDKGTEILNQTLHAYFAAERIQHQTSVARTPEQNGIVERRNRTLVEAARTMLSATKVPLFFWAEAIAIACFTQNRSLVIPRHEKTPYHIINDQKPSVKFFHIFGSNVYPPLLAIDMDDCGRVGEYNSGYSFWSTAKAKTINREAQIHAKVDGKKIIVTELFVRRDLRLADEEGVDCLSNSTIFEQLALMSPKTTAWNEFSSTVASSIICLAANQQFNFSKWIVDSMKRNLDNVTGNFLMHQRKPKRKNTKVSQPSGSTKNVADEAVHKELGDRIVRAVTTASILEAEPNSGNIDKTQSKATPNESSSKGTNSGGGPRSQETMGDTTSKLGLRVVLELEKKKSSQHNEIASFKRSVKKLEKSNKSRTHKMKRLYKDGLIARVESSNEESLGEDASKQGRRINATDQDEDITLVNVQDDVEMFDVNDLGGEKVFVAEQKVVSTATTTHTTEELTLAQALEALKTLKPKVRGIVIQEQEEPGKSTTTTKTIPKEKSQEKGKGIMVEEPVKPKKKDQIRLDEEAAKRLQAEFDEEERLKRLQAQEQEKLSDAEKATLFVQLLKKRRKHFTAKRVEEKRNKPPTQAQKRKIMCTYLKNMKGYKLKDLKSKEFDKIQEMFGREFKRQKVDYDKEKVELKQLMEIILDKEEVAIDAIPLVVKSSGIVDWKIYKEGKKSEDLEDLYKLLNARYGSTRSVDNMMQSMQIYILVEKQYPLTPPTLSMMRERKLQIDYESEMAYQLCKLIKKQLKNYKSVWKHPPCVD